MISNVICVLYISLPLRAVKLKICVKRKTALTDLTRRVTLEGICLGTLWEGGNMARLLDGFFATEKQEHDGAET